MKTVAKALVIRDNFKPYSDMVDIVENKMESFKNDFYVHDVHSINSHKDSQFIWFVYYSGTRLVFNASSLVKLLESENRDTEYIKNSLESSIGVLEQTRPEIISKSLKSYFVDNNSIVELKSTDSYIKEFKNEYRKLRTKHDSYIHSKRLNWLRW